MELKMNQYQLPEKVGFNYEELKNELQAKVSQYENLIYSDEQIKEAKVDRSQLNKLKKALNDERIRLQKEYMIPFNEFKAKIDELISIIDKPVGLIDKQVREYEEQQKADKLAAIKGYWEACEKPFDIPFEKVMSKSWLNASVSLKSVYGAIDVLLEGFTKDLATLQNLPEFSFEAVEVYKTTLDLNEAIKQGKQLAEMAKRKAEAEMAKHMNPPVSEDEEQLKGQIGFKDAESFERCIPKAESVTEYMERKHSSEEIETEEREWIGFKAHLTVADAQALANLFAVRGIKFERIAI